VAGPLVGVHNDALIVAGGANFPHGVPWNDPVPSQIDAGMKIYWDDIFVLTKNVGDMQSEYRWQRSPSKLSEPVGYGVSVSTPYGVICIGGESKPITRDADGDPTQTLKIHDGVFVLRWNPRTRSIELGDRLIDLEDASTESAVLPKLTVPTTALSGALIGSVIYVAGGDSGNGATTNFWALDLAMRNSSRDFRWRELPAWPGPPRVLAIAAAQSDGAEDCFYLFSGRQTRPGQDSVLLADTYRFRPSANQWQRLSDSPRCLMAGTGLAAGAHHVLIFGGDVGNIFQRLEKLGRENNPESLAEIRRIHAAHPGFNRDILAYHTVTDTWTTLPDVLPEGSSHVTTQAVRWDDRIVIPTGEVRPGIRSAKVWQAEARRNPSFGLLNYAVLVLYLAALVLLGVFFSRRMQSTEDFFKAGQRIPWWAAGISIFGTQLSAITFMAIPAKTYATDWRLLIGNLMIVAAAPVVVCCFLPFYRRLNVTTAYEYLELRFNRATRLLASGMFILMQFGRIGIVLLLPSIALSVVTGIDVKTCVLTMGLLCIVYTVLGGIEAVIWTDVLQVVVLAGGALLCLLLIPRSIEGGWNEMISIGESANRFRLLDLRLNWTDTTFFVMVFGAFGQNLISYGSDQVVIQRYLTTRDEATARLSIWTAAIMSVPASLLFFLIGTALFAYFKTHPAELDPILEQPDAIFAHYIVNSLPTGVAGLVIAAVFAAAMSSLDSSMNSVAAAFTADFYRRRDGGDTRGELWVARIVTVVVGLCGTMFAIWMSNQPNIKSLWDQFAAYLGLFGGGLCGLFLLAIFTQRTSATAALIALVASAVVQFLIRNAGVVSPWLYSATGIVACFVIGYVLGFLFPQRRSLSGLTLATLDVS
jgi:SSS family transporter